MAIPIVHQLGSIELDRDKLPVDPESCAVLLTATIGNASGGDNFSFTVVTPDRLLAAGEGARWGRGYLVVERFSWDGVERMLSKLVLHADRASWQESARELAKELNWEFEGYTDASRG